MPGQCNPGGQGGRCRTGGSFSLARDLWRPRRAECASGWHMESADTPPAPSPGSQTRRYHGVLIAALQPPWAAPTGLQRSTKSALPRSEFSLAPIAGPALPSIRKAFYSSRIFTEGFDSRVDLRAGRCASGKARVDAPGAKTPPSSVHS